MPSDGDERGDTTGTGRTTVELDTTVVDSVDLANIGCIDLADGIIEVAGEPDQAGTLDEKVRVTGAVMIERVADTGEKADGRNATDTDQ